MVRAPERERKGRRVHSGGCLAAYTLWKEGQCSMEEKVKLKDIAERLGVSIVAVSKALNDKDGISDKLKEKVRQVALEMGYETAVMRNRLNRSAASILVIVARNALSDINMTQSFYLGFFEKLSEEFLTYRYLTQLFVLEQELKILPLDSVDAVQVLIGPGRVEGEEELDAGAAGGRQLSGHRHHHRLIPQGFQLLVKAEGPEVGVEGGDLLLTW